MRLYYTATAMLVIAAMLITWVLCANRYVCSPDVRVEVKVVEDTVKIRLLRDEADRWKQSYDSLNKIKQKVKIKYDTIYRNIPVVGSVQSDSLYRAIIRQL